MAEQPLPTEQQPTPPPSWYDPKSTQDAGLQAIMSTLPLQRQGSYDDIVEKQGLQFRVKPSFGASPWRPKPVANIQDETTEWWDTFESSWNIGMISASYRAIKRGVQNSSDTQTPINSGDYFAKNWQTLPETIQIRYIQGRYDHLKTEESLMRLMIHDNTMDTYRRKVENGSRWASFAGGAADFVVGAAVLELATLPIPGAGTGIALSTRAGVGAAKLAAASRAGLQGIRALGRKIPVKYLQKEVTLTGLKNAPKAAIPVETAVATGWMGAVQARPLLAQAALAGRPVRAVALAQKATARATVSKSAFAVNGVLKTAEAQFFQAGGLKLLEDDRTWSQVAQQTAVAAALGGLGGFGTSVVRNKLAATRLNKIYTKLSKREKLFASPGFKKPTSAVGKLAAEKPSTVIESMERARKGGDYFSIPARIRNFVFQNTEKLALKLNASPTTAFVTATSVRSILMAGPYALSALAGVSFTLLSLEGVQDWTKSFLIKQIVDAASGKEPTLAIGDNSGTDTQPAQAFRNNQWNATQPLRDMPDEERQKEIEQIPEVVDKTYKGLQKQSKIEFKDLNDATSEAFIDSSSLWMDTFSQSAADIDGTDATPKQMRTLAAAYREEAKELAVGATVGEMFRDSVLRVAGESEETQEFQQELDRRYFAILRNVDQTDLAGAVDDIGIEYVGQLTTRMISGTLATLLEAKADGRLGAESVAMREDANWLSNAAGDLVREFVEQATTDEIFGLDWVGQHRTFEDEEQFMFENMLEGYSRGAGEREATGTLTAEDDTIDTSLHIINVTNLFSSFKQALFETIPGQGEMMPTGGERSSHRGIAKEIVSFPTAQVTPEPTDLPDFVAPLGEATDLPDFKP